MGFSSGFYQGSQQCMVGAGNSKEAPRLVSSCCTHPLFLNPGPTFLLGSPEGRSPPPHLDPAHTGGGGLPDPSAQVGAGLTGSQAGVGVGVPGLGG